MIFDISVFLGKLRYTTREVIRLSLQLQIRALLVDHVVASYIIRKQISLDIRWLTADFFGNWCPHTDSNRGPIDYKSMKLLFLVDTTEKYINTLDTTEYYVYTLPDTINILFLCDLL